MRISSHVVFTEIAVPPTAGSAGSHPMFRPGRPSPCSPQSIQEHVLNAIVHYILQLLQQAHHPLKQSHKKIVLGV